MALQLDPARVPFLMAMLAQHDTGRRVSMKFTLSFQEDLSVWIDQVTRAPGFFNNNKAVAQVIYTPTCCAILLDSTHGSRCRTDCMRTGSMGKCNVPKHV